MEKPLMQLYPQFRKEVPLKGLYLAQDLRQEVEGLQGPMVYSNYITSLDGRIAAPDPSGSGVTVPEAIANRRDWRLFQELAVQSDVLISSGRYLREYARGEVQEILQVFEDPQFADLKAWRIQRGLQPNPDLAVISASLRFPVPEAFTRGERRLLVITSQAADPARGAELARGAAEVITAGETDVEGKKLLEALEAMGYRLIYNTAGPKVLHLLLEADVLDRLYLTLANRILGGEPFSTIVEGKRLQPPRDFHLRSLYIDPHEPEGGGQLFACYQRSR